METTKRKEPKRKAVLKQAPRCCAKRHKWSQEFASLSVTGVRAEGYNMYPLQPPTPVFTGSFQIKDGDI